MRGRERRKRRSRIRYGERQGGCPEDQNELQYVAVWIRGQREPLECPRDLGCERLLGLNSDVS